MFRQPTFAKAVRVPFPGRQSSCPPSRVGARAGGHIRRAIAYGPVGVNFGPGRTLNPTQT